MPTQITENQAAEIYLAQLQSEAVKLPPVKRNIKMFIVKNPVTKKQEILSYVDLITQVINRTSIGMTKAIEYVQQLEINGEPMYQIVG